MKTYKGLLKYIFTILHESTQVLKQFSDQFMFETELKINQLINPYKNTPKNKSKQMDKRLELQRSLKLKISILKCIKCLLNYKLLYIYY